MRKFHFNICIQGDIMAQETINFSLTVNPATQALKVVDANGNPLNDGDSVTLTAQQVGVADPGQELFTVSGGQAPYSFSIASGSIPDGDSLNSVVNADGSETVSIEGTPTTAGTSTFAVMVSDSAGAAKTVSAKKTIS
jgi:large repetitive protein